MDHTQHERDIIKSKSDASLRQSIIQRCKPYIINTVGHICKRFITWSDEESSIGLLAFNRAIDTYDPQGGRQFMNYAYLLIQRDLINYFRQIGKFKHLSLDHSGENESAATIADLHSSMGHYQERLQTGNLIEEILGLDEQLRHFGIGFEQLEEASPKHKDTRQSLHQMVFEFLQHDDLKDELLTKKRFPMTSFSRRTQYSVKTMERYRKYLISLIVIKLHPEWVQLSSYIHMETGKEGAR